MSPLAVDKSKLGQDARLERKRYELALDEANNRIAQIRQWYLGVRARYGAAKL